MQKEIILAEIAELEKKLVNVHGTKCEVYSRIVGYFRPVKDWNKGQAAQFKDRVNYEVANGRFTARQGLPSKSV